MEDRWHRRRRWCCWPCCRGRSCSSRTSPSPRRSCSSHTLCSKPGRGKSFKFKIKSVFFKSCRQEIFTCVCIRADYCIYIVQSLRFNNGGADGPDAVDDFFYLVLRRTTSAGDPAFWGKTHRKTQIYFFMLQCNQSLILN